MRALVHRLGRSLASLCGTFLACHLGLCKVLACLGSKAAIECKLCCGWVHQHEALFVAAKHRDWNLDGADKLLGESAIAYIEGLRFACRRVKGHVVDVSELLAIRGLGIHAAPDDAGVPIDAKTLARRIVEALLALRGNEATLAHLEGIIGNEEVWPLHHACDIGLRDRESHDVLSIRREHRHVHTAQALELLLAGAPFFLVIDMEPVELGDTKHAWIPLFHKKGRSHWRAP